MNKLMRFSFGMSVLAAVLSLPAIGSGFETEPLFTPDILAQIHEYRLEQQRAQIRAAQIEVLNEVGTCEFCHVTNVSTFLFCDTCGKLQPSKALEISPSSSSAEASLESSDCAQDEQSERSDSSDEVVGEPVVQAAPVVVAVAPIAAAAPKVLKPRPLSSQLQKAPAVKTAPAPQKACKPKKVEREKKETPPANECWDWKKKGYCGLLSKKKKCPWEHHEQWRGYNLKG